MGNVIKKMASWNRARRDFVRSATNALGFPFVFQALFFGYAMFGAIVFMILDLRPLKPFARRQSRRSLRSCSMPSSIRGVHRRWRSIWPQYDPEDEKGKIEKISQAQARALRGRQSRGSVAARQGAR
jgi:hypothetical protein